MNSVVILLMKWHKIMYYREILMNKTDCNLYPPRRVLALGRNATILHLLNS